MKFSKEPIPAFGKLYHNYNYIHVRPKEFNSHACVKCENWFHKHCLCVCGIKPPKRTQDFICPNCTIPPTVP